MLGAWLLDSSGHRPKKSFQIFVLTKWSKAVIGEEKEEENPALPVGLSQKGLE